ncbi:heme NO-binding domain-containing protein, partial [Klebsiella pneumoniae]|nr:heme NO-binding domain-containing protein [Klebsiella pneumoniae]
ESFQATSIYGEGMPIEIARAASEVLGCSLDALLEACGEFYITVCVRLPSPLLPLSCSCPALHLRLASPHTTCNQWRAKRAPRRCSLR